MPDLSTLHSAACQLVLNETGKNENFKVNPTKTREISGKPRD